MLMGQFRETDTRSSEKAKSTKKRIIRTSRPRSLSSVLRYLTPDIQELCLHHAGLDGKTISLLAHELKNKNSLTKLSLAFNRLGDEGVAALASVFARSLNNLLYLNLARNHISSKGCIALSKGLEKCMDFRYLDMAENKIGDEGVVAIVKAAKYRNWQTLVLSKNRISRKGFGAIATLVRDTKSLKSLSLYLNDVDMQGCIVISDALMLNKSLQYLDVGANPLGSHGVFALVSMLGRNRSLQSLDLRGTDLGFVTNSFPSSASPTATTGATARHHRVRDHKEANTKGILRLCEEISQSACPLKTLLLSFNSLGEKSILQLSSSVAKSQLEVLAVVNCDITQKGMVSIAKMLGETKTLRSLDIGLNTIETRAAKALAESLRENKTLTQINMVQCRLGRNVCCIAKVFPHNHTLRTVSLGGNCFDETSEKIIAEKLKANYSIGSLGKVVCRCPDCHYEKFKATLKKRVPVATASTKIATPPDDYPDDSLDEKKQDGRSSTKATGGKGAEKEHDCIKAYLRRNRGRHRRLCKIAFLLGSHTKAGGDSHLLHVMGKSSMREGHMFAKIFEFAGL